MHAGASGRDAAADASIAAQASIDRAAAALATGGEELLRHVLTDAPVGLALVGPDLRWQWANPAFCRTAAVGPERLLGRAVAATALAAAAPALDAVLVDGSPREPSAGHPAVPRLRLRARRLVIGGRTAGLVVAALGPAEEPRPAAAGPDLPHELEQARIRLAVLDAAAGRIGTTLDVDTTCVELADFTVPALADLATVELLPPDAVDRGAAGGTLRLHRAAAVCTAALKPRLAALARPGESVRHPEGSAVARCLRSGAAVAAPVREGAWPGSAEEGGPAAYRAAGLDSVLAVPLTARGRVLGVLALARAGESARAFTEDDTVLVGDLAGRAAVGIDNARRYTRSQGIALQLQRALLAEPGNPHPNLELASRYLPSGTSSVVGGDWYETVRLPFGRTLLVMGDVMGHGVEAAVDMSTYRSMLRDVAGMDLPPHRILRQLDALISENESSRPATCLLALADPGRNRWTFSSAGHLPPALVLADRPTDLVPVPTGPPLGTGLGGYEQQARELLPDQVLLLYTDGLVERRGEDIDVSLARLAALRLPAAGDLDDLLDSVLHALTPEAAEDDVAVLAARVRRR
ncbi:PP2C family protein-serine/threonine phosphatase [Streptomyces sp. NRRL B-24484]|uniref:PP2C family protein-serine/threonine phosphatase n=1 Tax=Streptomyces sp. NRRL B-24484 TaxID=1463833 RepID=UPI000996C2C9|nr:GAF domain-containing SpoIIE family protein phosphatase [Streptomyces sp. NRRL B-24484]